VKEGWGHPKNRKKQAKQRRPPKNGNKNKPMNTDPLASRGETLLEKKKKRMKKRERGR